MEVMTIDSLNGLRGMNNYALASNLQPNNIRSPLTVAQALHVVDGMYATFEAWSNKLDNTVGVPAPSDFLDLKDAAQQEFLLALHVSEDALAVLPVASTLDQTQIAQLQAAAAALGRLGQDFTQLERRYGKDPLSGNVIGVTLAVVGVAGLFWWLSQKKRTSRARKALGCASCGSKRR